MGKYKKYKNVIEAFLSGEKGQRFFNFAYSLGAAVVILGALFKILHLPLGNALLSIGMGTEVLMFVLTAFDRPPKEYHWEEVFPVLKSKDPDDRPSFQGGQVVVGGVAADGKHSEAAGVSGAGAASGERPAMGDATAQYVDQLTAVTAQIEQLRQTTEALNRVSGVLLGSYQTVTENADNISSNSAGYVEQMANLNRNLAGLNTIYEIQLKSISSQLDNIDRVNRGLKEISSMYDRAASNSDRYCEETQKMTAYMQQLNSVYEKMITAMTINMYRPMVTPDEIKPQPQAENPAKEEE